MRSNIVLLVALACVLVASVAFTPVVANVAAAAAPATGTAPADAAVDLDDEEDDEEEELRAQMQQKEALKAAQGFQEQQQQQQATVGSATDGSAASASAAGGNAAPSAPVSPKPTIPEGLIARKEETYEWKNTEPTTQMWRFCNEGNLEAMRQYVAYFPDHVHHRSEDGRGALFWAYEYGKKDIVDQLIKWGVSAEDTDVEGNKPSDMGIKKEL